MIIKSNGLARKNNIRIIQKGDSYDIYAAILSRSVTATTNILSQELHFKKYNVLSFLFLVKISISATKSQLQEKMCEPCTANEQSIYIY